MIHGKVKIVTTAILHYDAPRERYLSSDGLSVARERDTLTPNGNPMAGRWALRDGAGTLVDFDQYRNDLAERNSIKLVCCE